MNTKLLLPETLLLSLVARILQATVTLQQEGPFIPNLAGSPLDDDKGVNYNSGLRRLNYGEIF